MAKLRAAIYTRHSTGRHHSAASDRQIAACRRLAAQIGAEVVATYTDRDISGGHRGRTGLVQMLADIGRGHIDVVLCEALDRISRVSEDIRWLGEKLVSQRVRLFTWVEGEIDEAKLTVPGFARLADRETQAFRS